MRGRIRETLEELSSYRQFVKDCKVVFSSPQGQRVLRFLMKKGCVTTAVASADKDETMRNAGAQRLVLSILRACEIDERTIDQQIEEAYES